ncbi:hypothetical protein LTR78_006659 [Recurvomyces mirabilis]|uniref:Uncharacterized protein n=1 Tax=Recurvomyces mirabilis TaxID=574656 RepID=A0AAE0WKK4_9PEZI|nr:hypothetical protein LTR78_006659 [Recurvomyces mirabilis]KAK5151452.1 hypothetical protein LTS14_009295 [Recurvomyces mirabilis]
MVAYKDGEFDVDQTLANFGYADMSYMQEQNTTNATTNAQLHGPAPNIQAGHNGTSYIGNTNDPSNVGHHPLMVYENGEFNVDRSFANLGTDLEALVQERYAANATANAQMPSQLHRSVSPPQPRPLQQQQQQQNSNPNNLDR